MIQKFIKDEWNREQKFEPDGFFVVHEGLVQFALLLQYGGQIGMGGGEIGEHIQRL